jgi:hypothetical protein
MKTKIQNTLLAVALLLGGAGVGLNIANNPTATAPATVLPVDFGTDVEAPLTDDLNEGEGDKRQMWYVPWVVYEVQIEVTSANTAVPDAGAYVTVPVLEKNVIFRTDEKPTVDWINKTQTPLIEGAAVVKTGLPVKIEK